MHLAPKLVLKDKGATAQLPTLKQALITLKWKSNVDLDLMLFGKKKDGTEFSVFTKLLGGSQGDLNSFPFIQLSDDAGVGASSGDKEETITIAQIDSSIDELHIVCLNYTEASRGNSVAFNNYDATINIINDKSECLVQGQLNDTSNGIAAHLCTIKNGAIGAQFVNQNKVYDIPGLVANIPGSKAIFK